jgi:hypothetical protein
LVGMRRLLLPLVVLLAGCAVREGVIVGSDHAKPRIEVTLEALRAGGRVVTATLPTDLALVGDLLVVVEKRGRLIGTDLISGVFGTVGALNGRYVFGDNASGRLWALDVPTGPPTHCGAGPQATAHALGSFNIPFTAFAASPTQLLVAGQGGTIWTITPR